MMPFCIPLGGNDAVWILAGGNNAGGFKQAEMMQFWHPVGENDVTVDANRIYFVDEQS
jgi:hypothetical protein